MNGVRTKQANAAVGARCKWYAPALALRNDIERTDGIDAGKRFIASVLNCPAPKEAMETVERKRAEWNKRHATER